MMPLSPFSPLALLGCGNMGRAMLDGWLAAGIDPACFVVLDPHAKDLPTGIRSYASVSEAGGPFSLVLLGIKPQLFDGIKADVCAALVPNGLLLSMLAGTRAKTLADGCPGRSIVRIMPNLAAALGKAPIGIWSNRRSDVSVVVDALLAPLGTPIWIDDEAHMDAVTALAGSGPAFVYRFIDALTKAAIPLGLSEDQASAMAVSMVEGAAILAARSQDSPETLAAKVTSKGGTTAAGLAVLDEAGALEKLLSDTLRAARDRGVQLSRN